MKISEGLHSPSSFVTQKLVPFWMPTVGRVNTETKEWVWNTKKYVFHFSRLFKQTKNKPSCPIKVL